MDIKDFTRLVERKRKQLDTLMKSRMPVIAGRIAKDHFQENFRLGGFVNGGLHPWPEARRRLSGAKGAAANYGTLLSGRKHLFSSIKYMPADYRVTVADEVGYAPVHNWGATLHPIVTDRMRRFAWAKYYEASGKKRKAGTGKKKARKRAGKGKEPENRQAQLWKRLALTKKERLDVRVPQRQFLGESRELYTKINDRTEKEIRKILNL